jgi:hypothetical protein
LKGEVTSLCFKIQALRDKNTALTDKSSTQGEKIKKLAKERDSANET